MTKSEQIKNSLAETRLRRTEQTCKVYELKIDKSHLSKEKLLHLNRLFLEAKWLYNYQLSQENVFEFDYKVKEVQILNKDVKESRDIKCISSQMKQALVDRLKQNISALSKSKTKGNKVGGLKFKSRVNSIPLKQYGSTYQVENTKYIKIQGMKRHVKVRGLEQIPVEAEFANGTLIQKADGIYLKITCFLPKEIKIKTDNIVGLDFGIKDNIVDSNGNKYNFQFPETRQLKKVSKKVHRSVKGSKNRYKLRIRLQKQYDRIDNQKKDVRVKFVSELIKNNDYVCVQDESLNNWKRFNKGFGRRIQHSVMGGIISDLKKKSETLMVRKFYPSTKTCFSCSKINKISLKERVYSCSCGYQQDRDIHSARNILREGLKQISMEHRNTMLGEDITSVFLDTSKNVSSYSLKQEATTL